MALQARSGYVWQDLPIQSGTAIPQTSGLQINASGEKAAFLLDPPKTGEVDWFEFLLTAVAQAPANGLRLSWQAPDGTTGDPDGVVDYFRDITSGISVGWMNPPGPITSDGTNGGFKKSLTRGVPVFAVVAFTSFSAGDDVSIGQGSTSFNQNAYPYNDLFTTSWTKQNNYAIIAIKYADGSYPVILGAYPIQQYNALSLSSSTTPDEIGILFNYPFKTRIGGFGFRGTLSANTDVVLYDASGAALKTRSLDSDLDATGTPAFRHYTALFSGDQDIDANTNYRLVLKPTTTTAISLYEIQIASSSLMTALPGGSGWQRTDRTDGGTFSETNTKRPLIWPIESGGEEGSAGVGTSSFTLWE